MNKNNLIKVLIASVVFIILTVPLIYSVLEEGAGFGSTAETSSSEESEVKIVDGTANIIGKNGEISVTSDFDTIETSEGIIPNLKSGNIVFENGNPVSGKLVFSDDSSFDLDGNHITIPKGGSIEFKDGKIIVSKDTTIEVDDTKIQAVIGETEIKMEKNLVEIFKGQVSVNYENSPDKIILIGKDSSVEVQTDEDEKFEFKNSDEIKELIINIGSFHESKDCKEEENCLSYQDMGTGMSGEEWNKIKIDGNALITKYYEEETIYEINFEDGKAKISRDLSKLAKTTTTFNQRTVINYNSGDITLFIETSVEKAEEKDGRINAEKGIIDVEYYDDTNVHIVTESPTVELPETQKSEGSTETTGTSDTPEIVETDSTKKAEEAAAVEEAKNPSNVNVIIPDESLEEEINDLPLSSQVEAKEEKSPSEELIDTNSLNLNVEQMEEKYGVQLNGEPESMMPQLNRVLSELPSDMIKGKEVYILNPEDFVKKIKETQLILIPSGVNEEEYLRSMAAAFADENAIYIPSFREVSDRTIIHEFGHVQDITLSDLYINSELDYEVWEKYSVPTDISEEINLDGGRIVSNVGGSLLFHGIIINTIGDDVSEETKAQLSSLKSIEGIEYYDFGKEGIVSYYGYNEEIQIPYDIFYNPDNEKLISSALGVSISEFNNIQNDLQTSNKKSALGNSEFKYLWQEASGNIYIDKGSGRVDVDNDDRYYKKYELLRQFGFITQEQAQEIEKAARDSQITNPDGIEQAHYGTISSYSLTNSMEDVAEFVAECYVNPELIGYLIRGYIK